MAQKINNSKNVTADAAQIAKLAETWAEEIQTLGAEPSDLDSLVHDHAKASSKKCSDINNQGLKAQIQALIESLGEPVAKKAIREGLYGVFENGEDFPWGLEGQQSVEILQHEVEFYYRGFTPAEMPESDVDHVRSMIKQGYNSGELCYADIIRKDGEEDKDVEFRGWWNIAK